MKMTKKKVFVTALAGCLVAILSMGSLAWFSAQDSVTNNFYVADSEDNNPDDIFSVDVYEKYDSDGDGNPEEYQKGITYDDILSGSTLKFVMGKKPNKSFGKAMADRPIVLNK